MSRRGRSKRKKTEQRQLATEKGTMTGYCWFGSPPRMKVLYRLRGITRAKRREIIEDWREDFAKHSMVHLLAGSTLKIYPKEQENTP